MMRSEAFDYRAFIAKHGGGSVAKFEDRKLIYTQGEPSDALFYIADGSVKLTFVSEFGKEALIAILGIGDFFGEACMVGRSKRISTATTTSPSEIVRFDREAVGRAIVNDPQFVAFIITFMLDRTQSLQVALIDHLFNTSEKRLARILLTLANIETGGRSNVIAIPINQEMPASMVGTTRSRINHFMNKFRNLGHIEYNAKIKVNASLIEMIPRDIREISAQSEYETS